MAGGAATLLLTSCPLLPCPCQPVCSCSGWQFVKGQEGQSVQEAVQAALQQLLDGRRAAALAAANAGPANGHSSSGTGDSSSSSSTAVPQGKAKRLSRPQPVVLMIAGRTDRGVHALGQVLSFYTWDAGVRQQASGCTDWLRGMLDDSIGGLFAATSVAPALLGKLHW